VVLVLLYLNVNEAVFEHKKQIEVRKVMLSHLGIKDWMLLKELNL
jgi:hypothetical protein